MAIPAIDNLSAALYVPKALATPRSQPAVVEQQGARTITISPSRSEDLISNAQLNGSLIQTLLKSLSTLASAAEKTNLPSATYEPTRVTLQGDITRILNQIDELAQEASVGSVSLLSTDYRPIQLETTNLGGKISAKGLAIDTRALGLTGINVLSDLGVENTQYRIEAAIASANESLARLDQLAGAFSSSYDVNAIRDLAVNANSQLSPTATGPYFNSTVTSSAYQQSYERGSFIDLNA